MSAQGISLVVLGFCLMIGGGRAHGKEDFKIRPNLPPRCFKSPNTQICNREVVFRWYYDLFSDSCKVFPYRGCPNPNSFLTKADCMEMCIRAPARPPTPWEGSTNDAHFDGMFDEPLGKVDFDEGSRHMPARDQNMRSSPFQRSPIEGRAAHIDSNYPPRNAPPMRTLPTNAVNDESPKPYRQNVGFPPRKSVPSGPKWNRASSGGMFSAPWHKEDNEPFYDHSEERITPTHMEPIPKEEQEKPVEFPSEEDNFDKFSIPHDKPTVEEPSPVSTDYDVVKTEEDPALQNGATDEKETADTGINDDNPDLESTSKCAQFPETGPCRAYIRRWYFDPRKADCFTFIYGGCEGNTNSFKTKDECMKTCATTEKASDQLSETKETPKADRRYMGLRRQSAKKALPLMITTTDTINTPAKVTTAPQSAPEPKKADVTDNKETKKQESDSESKETQEAEVTVDVIDDTKAEVGQSNPTIINHYHTYHNYGPHHTNNGDYITSKSSEDDSSSSSSSSSSEDDEKVVKNKKAKRNRKKNMKNKKGGFSMPTPFNMFYKFLKRLKPSRPYGMMKNPLADKKQGRGITFVKFLITKKEKNPDISLGRMNTFSPRVDLRSSRRPSPLSIFFSAPEPREISPFMGSRRPHYNNGPSYNNAPFYSIGSRYEQRSSYDRPPFPQRLNHYDSHPDSMSDPFHPLMFPPLHNILSPISSLLGPWNPFMKKENKKEVEVVHGEKNLGCIQPVDPGSCEHHRPGIQSWYYDSKKGTCNIFYYSGCGGNTNRFENQKQCHDVCMVMTPAPPVPAPKSIQKEEEIVPEVVEEKLEEIPDSSPEEPDAIDPEQFLREEISSDEFEEEHEETEPEEVQEEQLPMEQPESEQIHVQTVPVEPEQFLLVKTNEEDIDTKADTQESELIEDEVRETLVTPQISEKEEVKQEKTESPKNDENNENEIVKSHHRVEARPVVHTFEFAHMHLDNRMEYVLVIVIMILGGAALIILVAITAHFMYKKHKLATSGSKEAAIQKVFHAHAYPEVHKISVIELPRELPGVHDVMVK